MPLKMVVTNFQNQKHHSRYYMSHLRFEQFFYLFFCHNSLVNKKKGFDK